MSGNTLRGTPNRGQARGSIPFTQSPSVTGPATPSTSSGIPRPVLETQATQSEVGGSGVSASRQKQTKRDEV
ncbi:hypothetical protein CGRA01v4_04573 [Colletotrichum graminicola]|nr:hypothetical protein CGRA01v4_04573 [Colletotrichum graminicola]